MSILIRVNKIVCWEFFRFENIIVLVILHHPYLENAVSERNEMRRLIDLIEKGAAGASIEQNVEDLKLFANVASFLANKIDAKTKRGNSVKAKQSSTPKLRIPKPKVQTSKAAQQQQQASASAMPQSTSVATSSADFERLKRVEPQSPRNDAVGGFGSV